MDDRENTEVEKLIQQSVAPVSGLTDQEFRNLDVAYTILSLNFTDLLEHIHSENDGRPLIRADATETSISLQQTTTIQRVHNYVAALYSYNEHVCLIVNRVTPENIELHQSHFHREEQTSCPEYARKGSFLLGLRADCQHGDFISLKFKQYTQTDDYVDFELVFDDHQFRESDVENPDRYLWYANKNEWRYPIKSICGFHRVELEKFNSDLRSWLV